MDIKIYLDSIENAIKLKLVEVSSDLQTEEETDVDDPRPKCKCFTNKRFISPHEEDNDKHIRPPALRKQFVAGLSLLISSVTCLTANSYDPDVCDRRPLGTKTDPLYPNNEFYLEIAEIRDALYVPGRQYTVRLQARGDRSFIAFSISLKEDSVYNKLNPRRPRILDPGRLEPISNNAVLSSTCKNTIIQSDIMAKTTVEARWTAPGKGNKCVSIFAVVLEKPDIWYNFEGPLSTRVCEDPRKDDDMPPMEMDSCDVCEDARYELTFQGLWSFNTHPNMFPNASNLARFSDVVGASHLPDTTLYKQSAEATLGLKMLAEQGNTTQFEIEAQTMLPNQVRTVIKATSPMRTDERTVTSFRATRAHHRLSIAAGILPSPDWFVGVSNLELCDDDTNKWARSIRLNLYPMDAGTDKGLDFESPNEETSPPLPISQASIRNIPKTEIPPFARLLLTLVRTYTVPGCTTEPTDTDNGDTITRGEVEPDNRDNREERKDDRRWPSEDRDTDSTAVDGITTSEEPSPVDEESGHSCPLSQWSEWQECQSPCIDGDLSGLQTRFRQHLGDVIDQYCADNYQEMETQNCEVESCENEEEIEEE